MGAELYACACVSMCVCVCIQVYTCVCSLSTLMYLDKNENKLEDVLKHGDGQINCPFNFPLVSPLVLVAQSCPTL